MALLDNIRHAVQQIQDDIELDAVRYGSGVPGPDGVPTLTFRLGPHSWTVRCSVVDPQRLKPDEIARLRAFAAGADLQYLDLRLLRVHHADTPPVEQAVADHDDGVLKVLAWSQASRWTGQRVATCVQIR